MHAQIGRLRECRVGYGVMARAWKWFWVWIATTIGLGLLFSIVIRASGIWRWIAAAAVLVALTPVIIRIEYKLSGREYPRTKRF